MPGAAKNTQVGPVFLLHGAEAAVEAEEGLRLLVGDGDNTVADVGSTVSVRTSGRTAVVRRRFTVKRGGCEERVEGRMDGMVRS